MPLETLAATNSNHQLRIRHDSLKLSSRVVVMLILNERIRADKAD